MFFLGGGEAKKIVGCSMCSWIVRWCCVVLCWLIIGSSWEILTYLEAGRPGKYSLIHDDWSCIDIYIHIYHSYISTPSLRALVKFVFNTELKHHDSRLPLGRFDWCGLESAGIFLCSGRGWGVFAPIWAIAETRDIAECRSLWKETKFT